MLLETAIGEQIRAQFPILRRQIEGAPLVYLDSAASAHKPDMVIDAMADMMRSSYANVHRGLYTLANEATEAFEAARAKVQRFINAPSPTEIVFTKSGTEAINLVAASLAADIAPGDEIVLSVMEHHANIVPWHFLRERHGAVLNWVPLLPDGALDMDAAIARIGPKTKMVAMTHMSNVLGSRVDIAPIVRAAREHEAAVLLDGAQSIVHERIDVQALDVDFFAFTGHKLYGPTGIGVLFGKSARLHDMRPWQGGGEMIDMVHTDAVTYADPPHRFEAGTPPIVEAVGLGAAIDWLDALDRKALAAHEQELADKTIAHLDRIPGISIHGRAPAKGAIVSFSHERAHPHDLSQILDRYGVAVRAGHHCAQPLMRWIEQPSTVRISFAAYTSEHDVDTFLGGLNKALDMLTR